MEIREYQKTVYVSHPSLGLDKNANNAAKLIKFLVEKYPDILFISPIHTFGFMYHDLSWDEGMRQCIALLNMCDEMWVFGNWKKSVGCNAEIEHCKQKKIPFKIIPDSICEKFGTTDYLNIYCLRDCSLCNTDDEGLYCGARDLWKKVKHIYK